MSSFPNYLAAIDHPGRRVFVLSSPHLCAIKVNGAWQHTTPLSDEEIKQFELVTDLEVAKSFVEEARKALEM